MLDKHLKRLLKDDREAHPIAAEDFETWRANRITKRFFADISMHLIESMDNIGGKTPDECSMSAASYQAIRQFFEHDVYGWKPEELENE